MGYVPPVQTAPKLKSPSPLSYGLLAIAGLGIFATALFLTNVITLAGLPFSIIAKLWQDPVARNAYFGGNSTALHDRIGEMGIETDLKAYHRDRIANEVALDQYVHQLLYDRIGYVGESYRVNQRGQLVRRDLSQLRGNAAQGE